METAEFFWESAEVTSAHRYLLGPLRDLLGPPGGATLDVGCGNGALTTMLIREGYDVYGIDGSVSGISLANKACPGRFFLHRLGEESLPEALQGRLFRSIISTEVIEHLYEPRLLFRTCRMLLAPGGQLVVSTPYHGYLKNVLIALSGRMDRHFTALWEGGHIKFFSRYTLEKLMRQEGFSPTAFRGAGRLPFLWKSMLVKAELSSGFRQSDGTVAIRSE